MKKFISLIIVSILSLCLFACSSYSGTLLHYQTDALEIEDFFQEIIGSKSDLVTEDFSYTFSFKEESKAKSTSEEYKQVKKIDGAVNYEDGCLISELKLNGSSTTKTILPTIDGNVTLTDKITEKTLCFFDANALEFAYIFRKDTQKSKDLLNHTEVKTTNIDSSYAYGIFTNYVAFRSIVLKVETFLLSYFESPYDKFIYLNGDDITLVESHKNSKMVIKFTCNGTDLKSISITENFTSTTSFANFITRKINISLCDEKNIDKPSDKKEYKDEFDNEEDILDEDYQ